MSQRSRQRSLHEVFLHEAPRLYSLSQLTKTSRRYHQTFVSAFFAQHSGVGKELKVFKRNKKRNYEAFLIRCASATSSASPRAIPQSAITSSSSAPLFIILLACR